MPQGSWDYYHKICPNGELAGDGQAISTNILGIEPNLRPNDMLD